MVTLERLKYFVAAAELEHVGNAAKRLHISPSVISDAIGKLEEEFGRSLFLREKNRIKLNQHGKNLLSKANAILEATRKLGSEIIGDPNLEGHFRIGGSHFLLNKYLVPACIKAQNQFPRMTFEFLSVDTSVAISHIMNGNLDLALVFKSSAATSISEQVIFHDQFKIIVRENHPLRKLKSLHVSELSQYPSVTFRPAIGQNLWENHPALVAKGLSHQSTYYYDDTQTAVQILKKTNAWAFMPSITLDSFPKLHALDLNLQAPVNVSWIYPKNSQNLRLMNLLQKEIKT